MSSNKLDFKYLAAALLARSRELLPAWLPGGEVIGNEYTCANIRGGAGKSFKVNIKTGKWADFASGEKGGDLISLYAAIRGLGQYEAAGELARETGHRLPDPRDNIKMPTAGPVFIKPPKGTKLPSFTHPEYGEPTVRYTYRNESGDVLFFVCRYDPTGERKQFIPFSYTTSGNWLRKMWPAPRPLYGLDGLTDNTLPVMLCEGEKACESAKAIMAGKYVCLTWPGGVNGFDKADWAPIYGRYVSIWPDADEPGRMAALKLAALLYGKVKRVKILGVPDDVFDGWDAADALAEGMDYEKFKLWAKPLMREFEPNMIAESRGHVLTPEVVEPISGTRGPLTTPVVENNFYAELPEGALDKPVSEPLNELYARCAVTMTDGKNPQPIMNSDNVLKILEGTDFYKNKLWYDEFHRNIFFMDDGKIEMYSPVHLINIMIEMQRVYGLSRISKNAIEDALIAFAHQNIKNEAKDFISAGKWDGVERVEGFLSRAFGAADNEYVRAVSKNMWISIAARIMQPGCKVDNMVILEGPQGIYKSTSLMTLGGKFYGKSSAEIGTRDFYISLNGKLIVEMGELAAMNKAEVTVVKDMLSTPVDHYRPMYDRIERKFDRTCVFVGTTNDNEYLHDVTGARRFWPVHVKQGDMDYIKEFRMQFFYEAKARFERGEEWWQVPEEMAKAEQEARRVTDEWEGKISHWLKVNNKDVITLLDIGTDCLSIDVGRFDRLSQLRVGRIMRVLGWQKGNARVDGVLKKVWRRDTGVALTDEQIAMNLSSKPMVKNYANFYRDN